MLMPKKVKWRKQSRGLAGVPEVRPELDQDFPQQARAVQDRRLGREVVDVDPLRTHAGLRVRRDRDVGRRNFELVEHLPRLGLDGEAEQEELLESLQYWYDKTKSRVTFEYVVWKGINDRREDIEALVAQSQKRSAVYDIITNPTNVSVNVNRK